MFNFSANHRVRLLQIQNVVVVAARPPVLPPVRAALISRTKAEVRCPGPTIERCCARRQKILQQFARNSCFWYCCRRIAFAR